MINTILLVHEKDIVSPEQIFNRELKIFFADGFGKGLSSKNLQAFKHERI